ncbi:MAG TPA: DPP IV N-terminal domain-containing protein [Verrucomicrobiae bacterium]|nr:DPP IV N-terminal domain-containing protein [Verrucomicrobiae bacterium]
MHPAHSKVSVFSRRTRIRILIPCSLLLLITFGPQNSSAQDRLKTMPGYERYQKMSRETTNAAKLGTLSVTWKDGGKAFEFKKEGKRYRYEIASLKATEVTNSSAKPRQEREERTEGRRGRSRASSPARGRQYTSATSPDGKWKAFYRDHNVWLSATNSTNEIAITTDGSEKDRIKNGSANWVYGEELFQDTALWWSTNSEKLAFYRFDESHVPDFFLQMDQTKLRSTADIEPYMKAGGTNPIVDLLIYDLATKKRVEVDVRDGKPFDNSVLGHYVYHVLWSPDGKELLFHRTNRRQNVMEFCAADPDTGKCRVIVREEWPASWTENLPTMRFLKDGKRFIWASERTGWKNFYLYNLSGKLVTPLTGHPFEVANIEQVNEDAGALYYMAGSGDNPMKLQLHRVSLDGHDDRRLTDPAFHHSVDVAPDGKHFVDVAQTHDTPPLTRLMDGEGKVLDELANSDLTKFDKLGLRRVELLQFKAADGKTDLYGMLHFPSNFRPYKKYPLLVSVYAGPETTGARESFTMPSLLTEYGFLYATFDSRSASGRGKRFLDAIYLNLGQVEIDDQAAGVKSLWKRRYVDKKRVGIFGTSYGGTASALCLLRYPDVFRAACASSAVTDFRNYDTIYAERYMWLPQENKEGYDKAAVMTYAKNLKGRLLIYYGTADNNVHPNNSMQLIQSHQLAGKSFDVQVGPDQGHGALNRDRMLEFFIDNLAPR